MHPLSHGRNPLNSAAGCRALIRWAFVFTLFLGCIPAGASIEPAFVVDGHDKNPTGGPSEGVVGTLTVARSDAERRAALAELQKRADEGDAEAAFELGIAYRDALGVPRDVVKSRAFFERAAAKGHAMAFYALARMDLRGIGAPPDVSAGLVWLDKCAQLNRSVCLYEEAAIYYQGAFGVQADDDKALALGMRAADLGDRAAQWGVAKLYLLGEGASMDVPKGMALMRSLSEQGYGKATGSLGELYADPKIRNEFFDGTIDGDNRVPDAFASAVPADYAKAMRYWQLAAQQGNCHSLVDLGSFYDRGIQVALDLTKGTSYLAKAVRCAPRDSFYMWRLGKRLQEAKGVPRDCESAAKLFYASLVLGYKVSAVELGYLYDKGCGTILNDDQRALRIYLVGAKAGVPLCQNNVGAMLKHGRGIGTPDLASGFAWQTLAAENGDELAIKNLATFSYMFTAEIRQQGLAHLEQIRTMIHRDLDLRLLSSGELVY